MNLDRGAEGKAEGGIGPAPVDGDLGEAVGVGVPESLAVGGVREGAALPEPRARRLEHGPRRQRLGAQAGDGVAEMIDIDDAREIIGPVASGTPLPVIINYISSFTALRPGDVIITGTPGGVGSRRDPPVYMKPGDRIEVDITGIGTLAHPIAGE